VCETAGLSRCQLPAGTKFYLFLGFPAAVAAAAAAATCGAALRAAGL